MASSAFKVIVLVFLSLELSKKVECHFENSSFTQSDSKSEDDSIVCPPWTTATDNNTCLCGYTNNEVVHCTDNNMTVTLPLCFCMSFSEAFNKLVVGYCVTKCIIHNYGQEHLEETHYRYKVLTRPRNFSNPRTNQEFCSDLKMHRTGQLCGTCEEGFGPPVFSNSLACVNCTNGYIFNSIKYIAVAYLPLTAFYIFVLMFRISFISGYWNGLILTCQMVATPLVARMTTITLLSNDRDHIRNAVVFLQTFYSFWNLDVFRPLYQPFCLHSETSRLHVLAMDYAVAVYPLFLCLLTFIIAVLHERYPLVVRLGRPFYWCYRSIRNGCELTNSLFHALAAFLLLSYVKILTVSLDLLTPVTLFDMNGDNIPKRYLRVDGTVEYLGKDHTPFAILAMCMMLIFNILPLLFLCIFPHPYFQTCLNALNIERAKLEQFLSVIYSPFCARHPDNHERRYFATFYLLFRIINLTVYALTNGFVYFTIVGVVDGIGIIILAVVQPYRNHFFNKLDISWLVLLILLAFEYPSHIFQRIFSPDIYPTISKVWMYVFITAFGIPPLYFMFFVGYNIVQWFKIKLTGCRPRNLFGRICPPTSEDQAERGEGLNDETIPLQGLQNSIPSYQTFAN